MFLIQFYKFVLFLKSITKLVKHCNKNDEIKACVVELETAFSNENLTKKLLYGSYMGFSHTVYPVTPNAGMFYQRGYKQLQNIRREKMQVSIFSYLDEISHR